jgi:hypothetical protein
LQKFDSEDAIHCFRYLLQIFEDPSFLSDILLGFETIQIFEEIKKSGRFVNKSDKKKISDSLRKEFSALARKQLVPLLVELLYKSVEFSFRDIKEKFPIGFMLFLDSLLEESYCEAFEEGFNKEPTWDKVSLEPMIVFLYDKGSLLEKVKDKVSDKIPQYLEKLGASFLVYLRDVSENKEEDCKEWEKFSQALLFLIKDEKVKASLEQKLTETIDTQAKEIVKSLK